jgi:hypothetical protein
MGWTHRETRRTNIVPWKEFLKAILKNPFKACGRFLSRRRNACAYSWFSLSEFEFLSMKSFTRRRVVIYLPTGISNAKCVKRFETSNPVWLIYKIVIKWLSCSNHTEFLQKCLTRARSLTRSQWNLFNERSLSHTRRTYVCVYRHKNKYCGERGERERETQFISASRPIKFLLNQTSFRE